MVKFLVYILYINVYIIVLKVVSLDTYWKQPKCNAMKHLDVFSDLVEKLYSFQGYMQRGSPLNLMGLSSTCILVRESTKRTNFKDNL